MSLSFLLDVFKPMLTLLFFCLNVLNASSNDCGHYRTNASACGWDWSRKRRPPKERRRRCVKSVVTSMDCCRLVLLQEPQWTLNNLFFPFPFSFFMQLLVASMHLTSGKKDKDVKERKAEMEAFAPPLIDKLADYDAFVIVRDIYFFVRFFDGLFFSLLTTIDTPFCFPVLWCFFLGCCFKCFLFERCRVRMPMVCTGPNCSISTFVTRYRR